MIDRLYAKYMWLISTIYDAGKISFEDIARKWDDAYINDLHQPLKLRTFHSHRNAILMQFGVVIECRTTKSLIWDTVIFGYLIWKCAVVCRFPHYGQNWKNAKRMAELIVLSARIILLHPMRTIFLTA